MTKRGRNFIILCMSTLMLLGGVALARHTSTDHLRELCALGETMQFASKCGLGQSSPNAFLSIVRHFRHEILGRACATIEAWE